ncbi:MAG: methylenetetrahydrofolate reductase, partial [Nitrospirae bacterium]|nr:methylenetetrahydrofolate reductase [Nitrospirota bacterium]
VGKLNSGTDWEGNAMKGATDLYQGAVVTPESNPLEPQMLKFEKKIKAGANFFQTQAIYDMDNFKRFMDRARKHDVKVLAGILLLKNAGMANFLNKFVPGITVPQELIDKLKAAGKEGALDAGMDIAAEQVRIIKVQGLADGAHVMAIGLEDKVPDILQRAGIA